MSAESNLFGLDSTWWSAIGTFVALVIALCGAFFPKLAAWWRRPSLKILSSKANEFNSKTGDYFWLRLPIGNSSSGDAAKNVEVFLEAFECISAERSQPAKGIVPMRLKWCHGERYSCPTIPASGFRLLDLAHLEYQSMTFVGDSVGDSVRNIECGIPALIITGEAEVESRVSLLERIFNVTLTISADGVSPKQHKIQILVRPISEKAEPYAKVDVA